MPPKSAKSRHNSFLQQNSVKFGTNFTRGRKKFTPVLLARWNIFLSLGVRGWCLHLIRYFFQWKDPVAWLQDATQKYYKLIECPQISENPISSLQIIFQCNFIQVLCSPCIFLNLNNPKWDACVGFTFPLLKYVFHFNYFVFFH